MDPAPGGGYIGITRSTAVALESSANRKANAALGLYVAGGVVAATGVVLWIVSASKGPETPQPAAVLSLTPTPGGAALGATGRF
jgi:hypothetical protein